MAAALVGSAITTTAKDTGADMQNVSPAAPLKLVLTISRQQLKPDEDLGLSAKLVNVGQDPLSIFSDLLWGYAGGLTIHISDSHGHPVQPQQHDDDMVVPSVLGNPEYYASLFPDHFLGVERKDSARNLFPKPGSYSVYVEYRSPVLGRYAKAPNFWGREKGTIRSTPIHIEVLSQ